MLVTFLFESLIQRLGDTKDEDIRRAMQALAPEIDRQMRLQLQAPANVHRTEAPFDQFWIKAIDAVLYQRELRQRDAAEEAAENKPWFRPGRSFR